jgi:tRNA-dihydrouridine synthase C
MEGVIDHAMREMLTQIGGIDRCVTEFVRVTQTQLPERVFYRLCPELDNSNSTLKGFTSSGVPVFVQLLGSDCEFMALNAARAATLGAPGIDINFGCPAKTVNRNDGGSILLREPERVYKIVAAVRNAVPANIPVTAKIRLGFTCRNLFPDIVDAVVAAGANEITVHARTREDGYKPPAHWHELAVVKQRCPIPLIVNGEIWSINDFERSIKESLCDDIMLGRGILACPDLARQIKVHHNSRRIASLTWKDVVALLLRFHQQSQTQYDPRYVGNRLKQWLGYLRRRYVAASSLFEVIKRLRCPDAICYQLNQEFLHASQ